MIEIEEALRILEGESGPLPAEQVGLRESLGRVLAETVTADRDFPPTDRSAMDGFALRAADVPRGGESLAVSAEVKAGQPVGGTQVRAGEAVRIFTGAIVPPGADAVVMVERTHEDRAAGSVRVDVVPRPGAHIRKRGEELRGGDTVLTAGVPIHAAEVAALAAVGRTRVEVIRAPVVHVLSTGDEIIEFDRVPLDHQVRNSNALTLWAQLREMGIEARSLGIAPDTREDLNDLLDLGFAGGVLLISGGVSVGEYDLVGDALCSAGARVLFHKVAIKPGKPLLAARRGDCLVFGLPGNPVSAYTGFALFVAPVLRRLTGHHQWKNLELRATLGAPLRCRPGRRTYHLARLETGPDGFTARTVRAAGSGDVLALTRANGFVVTAADADGGAPGQILDAVLWRDAHLR